ncbi:type II secretion system protein [Haloferula sp.]|uniref:type II secretion system protein n=1 Tax=Haloferula sp. TaxID=2497595 RepID=UPI0032A0C527
MKSASPQRTMNRAGVTLLELSVVIVVLLSLSALLMVGAHAWRRGSDRAACVINIRNVQTSVRSYQNLYGYNPGTMPYADNGTQSIAKHLYRKGYITDRLNESLTGDRECPGGGSYDIPQEEVFPPVGKLYLSCSLESEQKHQMPNSPQW